MNDKEKLEAIEKIINKKVEEMDDPPGARGTKLNQLLGGIKQSEYEFDLTVLGSYFSTNALIVI
jgi:hypothetical protein